MRRALWAGAAALAVIYIVPFVVYGLLSAVAGLEPPRGASPGRFLLSVLVMKIGTAAGFVAMLHLAWNTFAARWLLYAGVWWAMFALGEIGQAIGPNYGWMEAAAGIVSEAIYFPLSAKLACRILRPSERYFSASAV